MAKNLDNAVLLDIYGAMLTKKQFDALNAYYNEDLSLAEIAENAGITRQGVHKSICAAQEYLFQLEDALGCARKYREITEVLDDMQKIADTPDCACQSEMTVLI